MLHTYLFMIAITVFCRKLAKAMQLKEQMQIIQEHVVNFLKRASGELFIK